MNQRNSTINLSNTFQPEIRQWKVTGKRFKKIRYRRNRFFNQSHLNGQKIYAWKPKAYSKKTFGQKIKKYSHFQTIPTIENTFSNFISNNTYIFIELQTILHTFSRYHAILTFLESYWYRILHAFPKFISSNTNIFREFLPN